MKIVSYVMPGGGWDCGVLDVAADRVFPFRLLDARWRLVPPATILKDVLSGAVPKRLRARTGGSKPDSLRFLPPVPAPPVVWANHGNAPMVWKFQEPVERRWDLPRVPYLRVRSMASLGGVGTVIPVPPECFFVHGVELAVVIGKPGADIPEDRVGDHIAGWTLLDDGFIGGVIAACCGKRKPDPVEKQSLDTISKCADHVTLLGPFLMTHDEIGDPYDLLLASKAGGKMQKRGWTGSYLMTAEFLISTLSRLGGLETGTVISLGAAGWDGCLTELGERPGARTSLEVSAEKLGALPASSRRVASRKRTGVPRPPLPASLIDDPPVAIWLEAAGDFDVARPRPLLHPAGVLARSPEEWRLPSVDGGIVISLLPAVCVDRTIRPGQWLSGQRLPGTPVTLLHARAAEPLDALERPTAYETRGADFLSGCHSASLCVLDEEAGNWTEAGSAAVAFGKNNPRARRFDVRAVGKRIAKTGKRLTVVGTLLPGDIVAGTSLCAPAFLKKNRAGRRVQVRWKLGPTAGALEPVSNGNATGPDTP